MPADKQSFWVTFYSYKGGVGRSTALANVAALLAANGRRVLMIDFDLEAPGLDSFEEFKIPKDKPGIVEYTGEYLKTNRAPSIKSYVHAVELPDRISGNLWLLPAGKKDANYNRQRSQINWNDLYQNKQGALFFENFKADIEQTYDPDYVLVDSRTGLTDVGGICTAHLPSLVVLLFALNEQNLSGIAAVAKVLEKSENAPQLLPVATPVPNLPRDDRSIIDERFKRAKELLGVEPTVTINYNPSFALRERVFTLGESSDRSPISYQYGQLKDALTKANPGGLDYLLRQAKEAIDEFDAERADTIRGDLEATFSDRSDAWQMIAELGKLLGKAEDYETALHKALEVDPNNSTAFSKLQGFLKSKKRHRDIVDLIQSLLKRDQCLTTQTADSYQHLLGCTYMQTKEPENAIKPFRKCLESAEQRDASAEGLLIAQFNLCEAQRRSGTNVDVGWKRVIQNYEATLPAMTAGSATLRMNRQQAIHIGYALLGKTDKAISLLEDVDKLARQTPSQERIFSVADYDEIPRENFIALNKRMIEAVRLGQLWDGHPLS
jgi:MinD-like ATPase involved in chromosome partitioning or flagellar assembly